MLVLTRKDGQSIVIRDDIRLVVLSVNKDKVRFGIEAPPSVTVDRQEIHIRRLAHPDGPVQETVAAAE